MLFSLNLMHIFEIQFLLFCSSFLLSLAQRFQNEIAKPIYTDVRAAPPYAGA